MDEWKSTFLEINGKHAPFKTIPLKKAKSLDVSRNNQTDV